MNFPLLPSADSEEFEEHDGAVGKMAKGSDPEVDRSCPINSMMAMVELIAERQTQIPQRDWLQWCTRLEQTFSQLKNSSVFSFFKEMKINPLFSLWHAPFRLSLRRVVLN